MRPIFLYSWLCVVCSCGRFHFGEEKPSRDAGRDAAIDSTVDARCSPDPELVTYFSFDEGAGNVVHDKSASGISAGLGGHTGWGPGVHGTAVQFDGVDSQVVFAPHPNLSFHAGLGSFTVSYWIRPTALVGIAIRPFEIAYCTGSGYILAFLEDSGVAGFSGHDRLDHYAEARSYPGAVQIGKWTHVAAVLDRSAQLGTIYINGKPSGTVGSLADWTDTIDCSAAKQVIELGGWPGFWFTGSMDDFAIYSRALSAPEVEMLFARQPDCL